MKLNKHDIQTKHTSYWHDGLHFPNTPRLGLMAWPEIKHIWPDAKIYWYILGNEHPWTSVYQMGETWWNYIQLEYGNMGINSIYLTYFRALMGLTWSTRLSHFHFDSSRVLPPGCRRVWPSLALRIGHRSRVQRWDGWSTRSKCMVVHVYTMFVLSCILVKLKLCHTVWFFVLQLYSIYSLHHFTMSTM